MGVGGRVCAGAWRGVAGMASGVERRGALRAQGNEHFRSARYEEALALYVRHVPPSLCLERFGRVVAWWTVGPTGVCTALAALGHTFGCCLESSASQWFHCGACSRETWC